MEQSIQRYKTLSAEELKKQPQQELELGRYSIEWGTDESFTWLCKEEDEKETVTRHNGRIIGVMGLVNQSNSPHFVSVDDEHVIQISQNRDGRLVKKLTGHNDRITGMLELVNGNLLTISIDGAIKYWNLDTYKCMATFDAHVESIDDIEVIGIVEHTLIIKVRNGTQLWSLNRGLLIELKGFTDEIDFISQLNSGNWLVQPMKGMPVLWSAQGEPICKFKFDFSVRKGFLELNNGQLLIKDKSDALQLWTQSAELIQKHVSNSDIAKHFDDLEAAQSSTSTWIKEHKSSDDYPQTTNSLGWVHPDNINVKGKNLKENNGYYEIKSGSDELTRQGLVLKEGSSQRIIWDFFFRPVIREIKVALKKNIDIARAAETDLTEKRTQADNQIKKYTRKRKFAKLAGLFFAMPTVLISLASFYALVIMDLVSVLPLVEGLTNSIIDLVSQGKARFVSLDGTYGIRIVLIGVSGLFAFITIFWFSRNRNQKVKQLKSTGNLALINVMMETFDQLIETIKQHRSNILASLPANRNDQLLNTNYVNRLIEQKIVGEIQQTAMNKFGIEKTDITIGDIDGAIILQDWSLIQQDNHPMINRQNEIATRMERNGNLVSAVRFVQFIFLTKEQVNVFNTYYDFIADKFIGNKERSFFYRDVSTVTRQDVPSNLFDQELLNSEITLSINNGENIGLIILKDESVKAISMGSTDNEDETAEIDDETSLRTVNSQLEQEENEINSYYRTEIQVAEESANQMLVKELTRAQNQLIEYLHKQIDIVTNYNADKSISNVSKDNLADLAYKNIKMQIEGHKRTAPAA